MLEKTLTAAKQAGIATDRIYIFDTETENPDPSILSWNALLEHGEADWVSVESPHETVASYNSTSGTSGLPKAAMITHSYHVSQAASQCVETDYVVCLPCPPHVLAQNLTMPTSALVS